jgi:hypothetical protein
MNANDLELPTLPPEPGWVLTAALEDLSGSMNLVDSRLYYWRIRATDQRGAMSAWSTPLLSFQFGQPTANDTKFTGVRSTPGGQIVLEWSGTGSVYVEYNLTINPQTWQTIAGPLSGTSWTITPAQGTTSGFYRLRKE